MARGIIRPRLSASVKKYHVQSASNRVEVWSTVRLPFEPKEWVLDLRRELREAVVRLNSESGEVLHGIYSSDRRDHCDIENVVLYNVGPSFFAASSRYGLSIERSFRAVHCVELGEARPQHYVRYSMRPPRMFESWLTRQTLAEFSFCFERLADVGDCTKVWHLAKRGEIRAFRGWDGSPLVLRLHVASPPKMRVRVANIIKPVVDGLISAFHMHDGKDLEELAWRVGTRLGIGAKEASDLLTDPERAVLGSRTLLFKRGDGIQWNPADDSIVALECLFEPQETATHLQMTGALMVAKEVGKRSP